MPECEVLMATHAVKNAIRNREFFKLASALETGAEHGMWTFLRYRTWLDSRKTWHIPDETESAEPEPPELDPVVSLPPMSPIQKPRDKTAEPPHLTPPPDKRAGRIEIEPVEGGLDDILKKLE